MNKMELMVAIATITMCTASGSSQTYDTANQLHTSGIQSNSPRFSSFTERAESDRASFQSREAHNTATPTQKDIASKPIALNEIMQTCIDDVMKISNLFQDVISRYQRLAIHANALEKENALLIQDKNKSLNENWELRAILATKYGADPQEELAAARSQGVQAGIAAAELESLPDSALAMRNSLRPTQSTAQAIEKSVFP